MQAADVHGDTVALEARTLLAHIDQVAHWLPPAEPRRRDLLSHVAEMADQIVRETPSRGAILNLQIHVWGLKGSPLRTLLNRRVAELCQLYGLPTRV
jgi:hypothetical protein